MSLPRQWSSDPHIRQTESCRQFLENSGDITGRVLKILELMEQLHVNLPIFLWAISWNVPELVSNGQVRFARATLMLSDELPGILAHWHRPPRSHGTGIRTKAAQKAMNDWALETLCDALDDEMSTLAGAMELPQEDLSEEALLDIRIREMISEVQIIWCFSIKCVLEPLLDGLSRRLRVVFTQFRSSYSCIIEYINGCSRIHRKLVNTRASNY
jgi:hypothetical protein